jgi:hypothetical protein
VGSGSLASRSAVFAWNATPCLAVEKEANVEVVPGLSQSSGSWVNPPRSALGPRGIGNQRIRGSSGHGRCARTPSSPHLHAQNLGWRSREERVRGTDCRASRRVDHRPRWSVWRRRHQAAPDHTSHQDDGTCTYSALAPPLLEPALLGRRCGVSLVHDGGKQPRCLASTGREARQGVAFAARIVDRDAGEVAIPKGRARRSRSSLLLRPQP